MTGEMKILTPPPYTWGCTWGCTWEEFIPNFGTEDRKDQQSIFTRKFLVKFIPSVSKVHPKCIPNVLEGEIFIYLCHISIEGATLGLVK